MLLLQALQKEVDTKESADDHRVPHKEARGRAGTSSRSRQRTGANAATTGEINSRASIFVRW